MKMKFTIEALLGLTKEEKSLDEKHEQKTKRPLVTETYPKPSKYLVLDKMDYVTSFMTTNRAGGAAINRAGGAAMYAKERSPIDFFPVSAARKRSFQDERLGTKFEDEENKKGKKTFPLLRLNMYVRCAISQSQILVQKVRKYFFSFFN